VGVSSRSYFSPPTPVEERRELPLLKRSTWEREASFLAGDPVQELRGGLSLSPPRPGKKDQLRKKQRRCLRKRSPGEKEDRPH